MGSELVGFGVVGLGMGRHHCKAIINSKNARLVAVCDIDEERLKGAGEEFGVKTFATYEEMLADPEIEAVSIATPSGMHVDMAIQALKAGKHILVEKPVDVTVDKVKKLVEAAKKSGKKAAAIFQSRTTPLFKRIKEAISKGRLGKIIGVHALLPWYRKQNYYEGPHGSWKGTWAMDGGGSLMNQGVHTVDLIQWLAGPVKSVYGAYGVYAHDIEAEDKASALLRFQNGALGTLMSTTAAYGGDNQIIVIHGEKGTITLMGGLQSWKIADDADGEEEKMLLELYGPKERRSDAPSTASDPMAVGSEGHQFLVEDLVEAIHEDRDPYITIESAMHAVQIVNAVYESGRTKKEVEIN